MMTLNRSVSALAALTVILLTGGCATTPSTQADRDELLLQAEDTVAAFKQQDPSMERFFDESHAYAIFPSVGKGAVGVGGAYGRGVAYENRRPVGFCDLSQGTIGLQLGGQAYSEAIFFETRDAFQRFKSGNMAFAAQTSAVAAKHGASADADYERGVAVFTMTIGGLMYEASIGGQKFSFVPLDAPAED